MKLVRYVIVWAALNIVVFAGVAMSTTLSGWRYMLSVQEWNYVKLLVFRPDGNFYLIGHDDRWRWELVDVNICMPGEGK